MRPCLLSLVAFSLTASAMTVLPPATAGDLYKWTDDKGRVHYTSTPPPETAKKAVTIDSSKLSSVNALPNDPHKTRAEGSGPADSSSPSSWTPTETASNDNSAPASPPALIPPSLLPPSNPPATAKPEQPAQPEIVEVVAQGMGTDANAALLNAYSNAVQQALGLYVDAETMVQNDQIVRDKILTYSKGFIQEASEISKSQANGLFQVNIRAKVKRQQLLEQAKANNITVKAVEGVSLHAQVESQIKQEKDAKALLEKALLPFTDTTFHRADLVPSTQEQSNPTINKAGTDDNFVTLDYKIYVWIDGQKYLNNITNDLIPILDQVAISKGDFTRNYKQEKYSDDLLLEEEPINLGKKLSKDVWFLSVLIWMDKSSTTSKWKWFTISNDYIPEIVRKVMKETDSQQMGKIIELSLLDGNEELIAFGNLVTRCSHNNCSNSPIAAIEGRYGREYKIVKIEPYFTYSWDLAGEEIDGQIKILSPKSKYLTVSVKISKEDLPRVKSAKLEVKPAGER